MEESRDARLEETLCATPDSIYSNPRNVRDVTDCYFYHTMDLPGLGRIDGDWDLRPNIEPYLGGVDFKGRRVLDVGCANGGLTFYLEQQGADVVSFDLDKSQNWELVPFAKWAEFDHRSRSMKTFIDRINNAFWFAHRLLGSKARVVNGSVYAIPDAIGPVDIVVLGSILLHLRDPFRALESALRLCERTVIIADLYHGQESTEPVLGLLPNAETVEPIDTWWDVRPEWVVRAIGVLGFEDVEISHHTQKGPGGDTELYTVVGKRTHGQVRAGKERQASVGLDARIVSVESPNGIESVEGKNFLWIGDRPTRFVITAERAMSVMLNSEGVLLGPSIRRSDFRTLCVRSAGALEEFEVRHRLNARVRLSRGANVVDVWCLDESDVVEQPNGDRRVLLLGVLNYHLTEGEPLHPGDRPAP